MVNYIMPPTEVHKYMESLFRATGGRKKKLSNVLPMLPVGARPFNSYSIEQDFIKTLPCASSTELRALINKYKGKRGKDFTRFDTHYFPLSVGAQEAIDTADSRGVIIDDVKSTVKCGTHTFYSAVGGLLEKYPVYEGKVKVTALHLADLVIAAYNGDSCYRELTSQKREFEGVHIEGLQFNPALCKDALLVLSSDLVIKPYHNNTYAMAIIRIAIGLCIKPYAELFASYVRKHVLVNAVLNPVEHNRQTRNAAYCFLRSEFGYSEQAAADACKALGLMAHEFAAMKNLPIDERFKLAALNYTRGYWYYTKAYQEASRKYEHF